jgi:hypothetical protein
VLLISCVMPLTALACAQKRSTDRPRIDPDRAAQLGLTEDALDPTERAGSTRWKPLSEPEGTHAPLSPERRRVGGPNPF